MRGSAEQTGTVPSVLPEQQRGDGLWKQIICFPSLGERTERATPLHRTEGATGYDTRNIGPNVY